MKKTLPKKIKPSLLFEIGTEEIPSGYFDGAKQSILEKAPRLLAECGYRYDHLQVFTTPRRIVISANHFESLGVITEEKIGPNKNIAYQNDQPTAALYGFLKSTGCEPGDIYFKETPRGTSVCVKIKRQFKPIRYFFETLPKQIEFPKLMRWEKTRYAFTRPIRWTFAFIGSQKQSYIIGDVQAGDFTFGHRFLSKGKIKVTNSDIGLYQQLLEKHCVILDENERKNLIHGFIKNINNKNEELLSHASNLVEDPFPVKGSFPEKYLKLPEAILEVCMAKQLKIFSSHDSKGNLLNEFVAVINGKKTNPKIIAKDYERVLCSRLEDAQFFVAEDTKTKLETKVEKLKEMIFLGSLGSYFDKTFRIQNLVGFLGQNAEINHVVNNAKRAAWLAKADLVSHLVYEFPELQGFAGSEYAHRDGESIEVSEAIKGQYSPRNLTEDFSELKTINLEGVLLSLSDRLDLLVGAFGLGIEPSGSADPYGLRRAAGGIVKLLRAHPLSFSLSKWIQEAGKQYGSKLKVDIEQIQRKLLPFFKERIVFELQVKPGTREFEVLDAILDCQFDDMSSIYARYEELKSVMKTSSFVCACKVMERSANILKGVSGKITDQIDVTLFQDVLERKLYDLIIEKTPIVAKLISDAHYGEAVTVYGNSFHSLIHEFFDKVKINADDSRIRANRQAMLNKIFQLLAGQVADLSRLTNLS